MNKIKFKFLTAFIALLILHLSVKAQPQQIEGAWLAADLENSIINVYQAANGKLYGKIIESENEDWLGTIILHDMAFDKDKNAWLGEIYSPKRKMKIAGNVKLLDDDRLALSATKFLITKTFFWTRKGDE